MAFRLCIQVTQVSFQVSHVDIQNWILLPGLSESHLGLSENWLVPLNPMVNDHYPY